MPEGMSNDGEALGERYRSNAVEHRVPHLVLHSSYADEEAPLHHHE
jgi:hypothetical protein